MYIFTEDFVNYFITDKSPLIGSAKWQGPMGKDAVDQLMKSQLEAVQDIRLTPTQRKEVEEIVMRALSTGSV